jgi:hypothetical protein
LVDFPTGASVFSDYGFDHDGDVPNRGRKVAFMTDADEPVSQAESGHYFRCTGDE